MSITAMRMITRTIIIMATITHMITITPTKRTPGAMPTRRSRAN